MELMLETQNHLLNHVKVLFLYQTCKRISFSWWIRQPLYTLITTLDSTSRITITLDSSTQPKQELPPPRTTQSRQQQEPWSAMPGSSSRSPTPPPPPKRSPLAPVQVAVPVLPSHHAPPLPIPIPIPNKQNNTLPSSAIKAGLAWEKYIRSVIEHNHK